MPCTMCSRFVHPFLASRPILWVASVAVPAQFGDSPPYWTLTPNFTAGIVSGRKKQCGFQHMQKIS